MPRPSPFAQGFRALRREPSVLAAEIGWRWLFGGVATALLLWAGMSFLHAIDVSKSNQFLLRTLNPELMGYAFREMFRGKWWIAARLGAIVSVSLSLLWVAMATIARSATTRVLVEFAAERHGELRATNPNLKAMGAIQFVRVALLWMGLAAYILSAAVAARVTSTGAQPHPAAYLVLFLLMFGTCVVVLSYSNWVLFLAPLFAVREGLSFSSATIEAARFSTRRAGRLMGLNLLHSAFRIVWLVFMSGIVFVPMGFAQILPKSIVFLAIVGLSLFYCAVADALFVARYAGYIEIAEQELHPEPPIPYPPVYLPPLHRSKPCLCMPFPQKRSPQKRCRPSLPRVRNSNFLLYTVALFWETQKWTPNQSSSSTSVRNTPS